MKEVCESFIASHKKSIFIELLENDNSVSIHKQSLSFLVISMFEFKRGLVPALCKELIPQDRQNRYEWRNNTDFTLPLVKLVHKELELLGS